MSRALVLLVALVLGSACSTATFRDVVPEPAEVADLAAVLGGSKAVFVLDRVENQRNDAVVLFDHTCNGARIQHVVRDTITLLANGRAFRAFTLDYVRDGHVWNSSYLSFSGRWSKNARGDVQYYSAAPSVILDLTSDGGTSSRMEMWLRVGDGVLTSLGALGGSCPGSRNDAREREMTYSRR